MSAVAALSSSETIEYQYNKLGTMRAFMQASGAEVMLDMKLVPQANATDALLTTLGGQAAEAREAGFVLSFQPISALGIEALNEMNGQWRSLNSDGVFAVVASLPE